MDIGMLWFDNDAKADIETKVSRAAAHYQRKYGIAPNLCYVHPSMIAQDRKKAGKVELRKNGSVMPNHFWIGVNGQANGNGSPS